MRKTTKKPAKVKCLTCTAAATSRGLCNACRQSAYRAINSGAYTEAELIRKRLILPAQKPKRTGPWTRALADK